MASIMSRIVTSPSMPPNSSTSSAPWMPVCLNRSSARWAGIDSGRKSGGRASARKSTGRPDHVSASRSRASTTPITRSMAPSHNGKREWPARSTVSRMVASSAFTSSQTISVRGVISERSWRSPKRKMLSTISRSAGSMAPLAAPCSSSIRISSSDTVASRLSPRSPSNRRRPAVARLSRRTTGRVKRDRVCIGRASEAAMRSGLRNANCLGTNSPITTLPKVIAATTMIRATTSPYGPTTGSGTSRPASSAVSVAPPNAPARMPMRVMPTCTVDSRFDGSRDNSMAVRAPALPPSARICSRSRREETTANSAMAKTPLIRNSRRRTAISRKMREVISV